MRSVACTDGGGEPRSTRRRPRLAGQVGLIVALLLLVLLVALPLILLGFAVLLLFLFWPVLVAAAIAVGLGMLLGWIEFQAGPGGWSVRIREPGKLILATLVVAIIIYAALLLPAAAPHYPHHWRGLR